MIERAAAMPLIRHQVVRFLVGTMAVMVIVGNVARSQDGRDAVQQPVEANPQAARGCGRRPGNW